MKLIIFELAGKKAAKKCHTIDDIIALGESLKKSQIYNEENLVFISSEIIYLKNNPKFIHGKDLPDDILNIDLFDVNTAVSMFTLRIVEDGFTTTIVYNTDDKNFYVSGHSIENNGLNGSYIGHFCLTDKKVYTTQDNIDEMSKRDIETELYKYLNYTKWLVAGIVSGVYKLKIADYVPIVKRGHYHIKPSTIIRHRKPCLVASHDRAGHFKVLRSPRYYKDGIVPENEDELRRIPVKGCHVKRDIERVVIQ